MLLDYFYFRISHSHTELDDDSNSNETIDPKRLDMNDHRKKRKIHKALPDQPKKESRKLSNLLRLRSGEKKLNNTINLGKVEKKQSSE